MTEEYNVRIANVKTVRFIMKLKNMGFRPLSLGVFGTSIALFFPLMSVAGYGSALIQNKVIEFIGFILFMFGLYLVFISTIWHRENIC